LELTLDNVEAQVRARSIAKYRLRAPGYDASCGPTGATSVASQSGGVSTP
jgi:hypothetical protein